MKAKILRSVIGLLAVALVGSAQAEDAKPLPVQCERACLTGLVDQYMAALLAHDPKRLPLAPNVKFTENGQVMNVGDGAWGTVTALGKYKHYVPDPAAGAVAFVGTVDESNSLEIFSLRLKIANRQISEIETLVYRNQGALGGGKEVDAATLEPIWDETLAPAERSPRPKMIEIANSYFVKIEKGNGNHPTPFDPSCKRRENGVQTTDNGGANPGWAGGCEEQISTGKFVFDTELRDRRFVAVDEEKGVVFAHVFFDHGGNVKTWKNLKTGEVLPVGEGVRRPSAWEIHELFKIKNGRIYRIEATLINVPYKMRSHWEVK